MPVANLALRFVLELLGIAALAYAGFHVAGNALVRALAAVGGPVALVILWAALVAPNTANGLTQPQKDVIGTVLLLAAGVALGAAGQPRLAVIFGAVVLANTALLLVFGQEALHTLEGMSR